MTKLVFNGKPIAPPQLTEINPGPARAAYDARYYAKNREKVLTRTTAYQKKNLKKKRAAARNWWTKNRTAMKVARLLQIPVADARTLLEAAIKIREQRDKQKNASES